MHNYYNNRAYMHGYYNTYIYYFINFSLSCLWLLSLSLSLSLCVCFFFLLSSPSGSNPCRPCHQPHHPRYRCCWLCRNPRLHGLEATRERGFGSRQFQWVLNGYVRHGGGDEQVGWEICHGCSWWWWWRWEDLRKFCLICLKSELFGL